VTEESHNPDSQPPAGVAESTDNKELDKRLAAPILKGVEGLDRAMVWAGAFLIIIAGLIAYSAAFAIPFHAADERFLVRNEALHSMARWPESQAADAPAPLTLFALAMNWEVTPGNAASFHALNVLLHLVNGVLVFLVCRRLLGNRVPEAAAMLSGAVFVLHPANVEAVASLAGRAQLLGAFFVLVSVMFYLRATRDRKELRLGYLGLGLVAYACAVGSWGGAWCGPFLITVIEAVTGGSALSWKRFLPLLGYLAVLGLMLSAMLAAQAEPWGELRAMAENSVAGAAGAGQAALRAVWPFGLSVAPVPWETVVPALSILAVLSVLAVLGAAFAFRGRTVGGASVAWFGFALLGGALAVPAAAVLADRMLYLPLAGLAWFLPWGFAKLPHHPTIRTVSGVVCAVLILLLGVTTYARTTMWQSEVLLWRDAVEKAPGQTLPKERLGTVYVQTARQQLAMEKRLRESGYETEASELHASAMENFGFGRDVLGALPPETLSAEPLYFLGLACAQTGDAGAAVENFMSSLRKDSSNQACALEIAHAVQTKASETDDHQGFLRALDYYEYASGLGEIPAEALASYASVLARTGQFEDAARTLAAAAEKTEKGQVAFGEELKAVQTAAQQVRGVENRAQELEAADAGSREARLLRAQSLVGRRRPLQASYLLESALADDSNSVGAWVLLGFVRARMGQAQVFLSDWPAPPGPAEQQGALWVQLAQMCASQGDWAPAETYLLSAPAGMAGVRMPLLSLGVLSLQLRQAKRAHDYLQRATEAYPGEYAPWLALCDLSMAQGNATASRQYLAEAQKRNAPADEVAQRQERTGGAAPEVPQQPGEVIIR